MSIERNPLVSGKKKRYDDNMIILLGATNENYNVLHKFAVAKHWVHESVGYRGYVFLDQSRQVSKRAWGVRSGRILVSSIFMPNCHEGSSHHVKEVVWVQMTGGLVYLNT